MYPQSVRAAESGSGGSCGLRGITADASKTLAKRASGVSFSIVSRNPARSRYFWDSLFNGVSRPRQQYGELLSISYL